jgi:choline dehydrogenase-like flavoprotein
MPIAAHAARPDQRQRQLLPRPRLAPALQPTPGRSVAFPRGRVVGGSSAVNTCIALRGMHEDYDEWADLGNPEWAWERVLPAFCRLERDLDFGGAPYHGDAGPIPIRRYPADELLPQHQAFLATADDLGYPPCPDANDPWSWGAGPQPMNKLGRLRVSCAGRLPGAGAHSAQPGDSRQHPGAAAGSERAPLQRGGSGNADGRVERRSMPGWWCSRRRHHVAGHSAAQRASGRAASSRRWASRCAATCLASAPTSRTIPALAITLRGARPDA